MSTESISIHDFDDDLTSRKKLIKEIGQRRQKIESYLSKQEPWGRKLTIVNIVCSAVATVFTAAPAVGGKTLLDAIGGSNTTTVRILLAVAALFSAISVIVANMYRSQEIATRLGKAQAADANLNWLKLGLELKQIRLAEAYTQYKLCLQETNFIPEGVQTNAQSTLDKVRGEIETPTANAVLEDVISCSGSAIGEGLGSDLHLWLAVRIKGCLWLKEGEVFPDANHMWTKKIHETGAPDFFSLALFVADDEANEEIKAWFENCDRIKDYPPLESKFPGLRWLDQVDKLRHSKMPQTNLQESYAKSANSGA